MKNYYEVLGFNEKEEYEKLEFDDLERAFEKKAREYDPDNDVNKNKPVEERKILEIEFNKIKRAFDVLSDVDRREVYDDAIREYPEKEARKKVREFEVSENQRIKEKQEIYRIQARLDDNARVQAGPGQEDQRPQHNEQQERQQELRQKERERYANNYSYRKPADNVPNNKTPSKPVESQRKQVEPIVESQSNFRRKM